MTARIGRNGEVKFEFWPDQPLTTREGEWRCRLGQSHWGKGASIEEALHDLAAGIEEERGAVERARLSLRDKKVKR